MCVAIIHRFNYNGHKSKNASQFMILTYLWPWKKSRSSNLVWFAKPRARLYLRKVWNTFLKPCPPKWQRIHFCHIRKHLNYLPWICAKEKNSRILIIYMTCLTVLQSFNWKTGEKFLSLICTPESHKAYLVCMIVLMYVAARQRLNWAVKNLKNSLQFILLTHQWLGLGSKSSNLM